VFVAEQNSVDLAWSLLERDNSAQLRKAIYATAHEMIVSTNKRLTSLMSDENDDMLMIHSGSALYDFLAIAWHGAAGTLGHQMSR
jgi:hypothetical protein